MSLSWDTLRTVLLVVRRGTLAGAADDLAINYTTVARRIDKAESDLGEILFERLADGYRPTETARLIASHAAEMEAAEHRLLRQRMGRDQELRGALTITAPQLLIAHAIAPAIDSFLRAQPRVDLAIRATNDLLDLTRREADMAIRIHRTPGDALVGRRLSPQAQGHFATPTRAQAMVEAPGAPHDWLIYDQLKGLPAPVLEQYPAARIRMRFDDMVAMAGAAQAGLGAVRMPLFLGRSLPGLVPVPNLPTRPYADIWAVAHADVWPSAKVQAFQAVLTAWFRVNAPMFVE